MAKWHRSFYGTTDGRGPPNGRCISSVRSGSAEAATPASTRPGEVPMQLVMHTAEARPLRHLFRASAEKRATGD